MFFFPLSIILLIYTQVLCGSQPYHYRHIPIKTTSHKSHRTSAQTSSRQKPPEYAISELLARLSPLENQQSSVQSIPKHTLLETCRIFARVMEMELQDPNLWINRNNPSKDCYNIQTLSPWHAYIQRKIVDPETEIAMWGDLHGSAQSLLRDLHYLQKEGYIDNTYHILKPNFYMLFLGDFVDRGYYGVETVYTLMRLKIANPKQVLLVRGNHEDRRLNIRYGFDYEVNLKYPDITSGELDMLYRIYDLMALALYLGCKRSDNTIQYALCCHGGIEAGVTPKPLLRADSSMSYMHIQDLERATLSQQMPNDLQNLISRCIQLHNISPASDLALSNMPITVSNGFLWSDFIVDTSRGISTVVQLNPNRGWLYGKKFTQYILERDSEPSRYEITHIFRAHQHYGTMLNYLIAGQGAHEIWGIVHTLLSSPAIAQFPYDSFTMVTTKHDESWQIKTIFEQIR